jgi:hypothetical protein
MPFEKMVDMAYSDDEKLEQAMPIPMDNRPDYPAYLRFALTHRELPMIGLEADCECEKGDIIDLKLFAEVTNVSQEDGPNGFCRRIELQIKEVLKFENETTEDEPDE